MAVINASPAVVFEGVRRLSFQRPIAAVRGVWLAVALLSAFVVTLMVSTVVGRPSTVPDLPAPTVVTAVETAAYPAWTVSSGDTLWTIAERVRPGVDPRAVVLQIQALNGLSASHVLQAGEVLQVPVT